MSLIKLPFFLSLVLITLLPFHAFLVILGSNLLGSTSNSLPLLSPFIASWKEIFIFILGILFLHKWWKDKKFPIHFILFDYIFFIFFGLAGLTTMFITQDPIQMIWGLKYDFSFFALFYLIRGFSFSKEQKETLLNSFFISGGIVLFFGLVMYFLPKDILTSLGYSEHISSFNPNKPLPAFHTLGDTEIRRFASTFAGPNQFGFYLIVLISFLFAKLLQQMKNEKLKIKNFLKKVYGVLRTILRLNSLIKSGNDKWLSILQSKRLTICYLLFAICALILTFSRSAWIAVVIVTLFFFFTILPIKKQKQFFLGIMGIVIILVGFIGVLLHNTKNETLLRSESTKKHYEHTVAAIKTVKEYPFGTGLGTAGPASIRNERLNTTSVPFSAIEAIEISLENKESIWLYDFGVQEIMDFKPKNLDELKAIPAFQDLTKEKQGKILSLWNQYYHERIAENWHLQMFQEFGIIGGILWLTLLFSLCLKLYKLSPLSIYAQGALFALIGLSTAGLFLHSFEDASASLSLFLLLGLVEFEE